MSTETPRTDAFAEDMAHGSIRTWSDFARQLERELAQARADLDAARKAGRELLDYIDDEDISPEDSAVLLRRCEEVFPASRDGKEVQA